jgi:hypothetical protein
VFVIGKGVFEEHYLAIFLDEVMNGRESNGVEEGFVSYVERNCCNDA